MPERCDKTACVGSSLAGLTAYFRCSLESGHIGQHPFTRENLPESLQPMGRRCVVRYIVENPEAIGDPNQTPRVRLIREELP
jgi:hypothetical protein